MSLVPPAPRLRVAALAGLLALTSLPSALAAPLPARSVPDPTDAGRVTAAARSVATSDVTSAAEARRTARVKVALKWYSCGEALQCATARVPLDYDNPRGATTEIGVLRHLASDRRHRIGSLFINPGGPSGSSTMVASVADKILDPAVTSRFDVVGIDPRGVGASSRIQCFPSVRSQTLASKGASAIPRTSAQVRATLAASAKLARGCSTTGRPLTGAASTIQVARDMEVIRRAVGDAKLSYLGWSYGTFLGQVYANLYPDRVRAITIDGVLDPNRWVGTGSLAQIPVTLRLGSASSSYQAFSEIMRRCDTVGPKYCAISGNARRRYDQLANAVARRPVAFPMGPEDVTVDYPTLVGLTSALLYAPDAGDQLTSMVAALEALVAPTRPTPATRQASVKTLQRVWRLAHPGFDFSYDNSNDVFTTVLCTDSRNPAKASAWTSAIRSARTTAPYFGEMWGWQSVACAGHDWTVRDEDAYRGPFTRRTAAPVLVVGNYHDPATSHAGAVAASKLLPNSRLLSSDSWGHTAYGTSPCVTNAVNAYLLTGRLPAAGTVCKGPQPFSRPLGSDPMTIASERVHGLPVMPFPGV